MTAVDTSFALWSDDPAETDLLSFDAVASTVADVLLDPALDPVALGLSGSWGSGKTTVLHLVDSELESRAEAGRKILVIKTDPWRYDPATGAKESLIAEVLVALAQEVSASTTTVEGAKDRAVELVHRLRKRIDWAQAIKLTAKTSLAFQLPSIDDLTSLIKPAGEEDDGGEQPSRGLEAFRDEFSELMGSEALSHVQAVAVLVDDLDRCLPETVIESLEAIRLFLAVPKMSFVIAADEARVSDAIRTRFGTTGAEAPTSPDGEEEPAKLYLHKIVQTTIPIPALSRFDTQAFLLLLQLQQGLQPAEIEALIQQCADVRRAGGDLDDLDGIEGVDLAEQLAFASRLTPILYEKLHGNPRRIKRFLNDVRVRQSIATKRGIQLDTAIVAKLMVLERLLEAEFKQLVSWLAQGQLRDQLASLEVAAGRPGMSAAPPDKPKEKASAKQNKARESADEQAPKAEVFGESMLRWAKLPPALAGNDLSPYLFLAAAFTGASLLDESLPEQLRDLAENLLSRTDQRAVSEADLQGLSIAEGEALAMHLGRTVRDQPAKQKTGFTGLLRIGRLHPQLAPVVKKAALLLPPEEVSFATPLLFDPGDPAEVLEVLESWKATLKSGQIVVAIDEILQSQGAD